MITPTEHLEVNGTVKMTGFKLDALFTAAGRILTSDADGYGTWQLPTGRWLAGPDDDIYYDNGKVGIWTQTPAYPLDVAGTAKMTGFMLGDSASAGHVLTADTSGVGTWRPPPPTFWYDGPDDDIYFADGKVGIWTGTPAYPLDVAGTVSMDGLKLGGTATAGHVLTADGNGVGTWQAPSESELERRRNQFNCCTFKAVVTSVATSALE